MRDKIYADLKFFQKEMLKILGQVKAHVGPVYMHESDNESWQPRCDVYETPEEFIVVIDLAGVEKDAIKLSISPEYLNIYGYRKVSPLCCNIFYHTMEIETGKFQRRIYFPEISIEKDQPKVTYLNGFLSIVFAKKEISEKVIPID